MLTVNFDFRPELAMCFDSFDPHLICKKLEIACNMRIIPGQTLLFFDEIQNCPKAIMALRYFKEILPEQHVIAAGSLLEFILNEEKFSFPVGRPFRKEAAFGHTHIRKHAFSTRQSAFGPTVHDQGASLLALS